MESGDNAGAAELSVATTTTADMELLVANIKDEIRRFERYMVVVDACNKFKLHKLRTQLITAECKRELIKQLEELDAIPTALETLNQKDEDDESVNENDNE